MRQASLLPSSVTTFRIILPPIGTQVASVGYSGTGGLRYVRSVVVPLDICTL